MENKITMLSLLGNIFLFIIKLAAGIMSNSLAILSDAFNSFTDIISYASIYLAVRAGKKKPDKGHPFGHSRAEPIAGLIMAVLIVILGFEILKEAGTSLIRPREESIGIIAISVLLITIVVKVFMSSCLKREGEKAKSPAMIAGAVDSRNDVIISSTALIGVLGTKYGIHYFDTVAAILIAVWILRSGILIGKENTDYLMGKSPDEKTINKIKKLASSVKGVRNVHDVRAQYIGNKIQAEVHIRVDKNLPMEKAHALGKKVQGKIEAMKCVNRAFIHIDPDLKKQ
ncbi:cation transporter [Candidatus Woesearchaeota archaeon]|nr:cation transporter [Candidatus Woesearchaeota archaeon]